MRRLVIVSNRVAPPSERATRVGGLAIGLRDALRRHGGVWLGWSGDLVEAPKPAPSLREAGKITYALVDLSPADHAAYYLGYANSVLWPLFHYRLGLLEYRREMLEGYLRVNGIFAAALQPLLRPDDLIWVHDYHLIPLGRELRRRGVANRIGFFLHIPFPTTEVLTAMPGHETLVESLCDYDCIGFQAENDLRAFADYVANEAHGSVSADGRVDAYGRRCRAGVFPIGIDTDGFVEMAESAVDSSEATRLKESLVGRALVIGVDRLDYSKGIPKRFEAFAQLLSRWPEHRAKVTLLQIAPVSRGEVTQYRSLRRELDGLAGHINGRFAEFDWAPIRYLNRAVPRAILAGFYRIARVGFVTPLRDGMNLVAKEYVAAQDPEDPGVLVLSRFAGAAKELESAIVVNPFDGEQMAEALHQALVMPLDERRERWRTMMETCRRNTVVAWRERFLQALGEGTA